MEADRGEFVSFIFYGCIIFSMVFLSLFEKAIKGLNTNEYQSLLSVPGIGSVYATGVLSEIGSIEAFSNNNDLAKGAGLNWTKKQS